MGCDIHIFLEVKLDGEWEYLREISQHRCYDLFAAISQDNYRFDNWKGKKLEFNNGLPNDLSKILKYILRDEDLHSHASIRSKQAEHLLNGRWDISDDLKYTIKDFLNGYTYIQKNGVTDFRLVYAFDN